MKTLTIQTFITCLALFWGLQLDGQNIAYQNSMQQARPFLFMENMGQVADEKGSLLPDIHYYARQGGVNMYIMKNRIAFVFTQIEMDKKPISDAGFHPAKDVGTIVKMRHQTAKPSKIVASRVEMQFIHPNPDMYLSADEIQSYTENFYLAQCTDGVRSNGYKKLIYHNIWPNIDLVLEVKPVQGIEYSILVHPGAKVSDIQLRWNGTDAISDLENNSGFKFSNSLGEIIETGLKGYLSESKTPVKISYQQVERHILGFIPGKYNPMETLVIDPTLIWSSYYGGAGYERGNAVALDSVSSTYITGVTLSTLGLASSGAYQTSYAGGDGDAFLAKFSYSGSLLWSTYFGGKDDDGANGVTVDHSGNVIIAGETTSTSGIASAGAYQTSLTAGLGDNMAFIAKFSPTGTRKWSTYFGGNNGTFANAIAADASGNIFITGATGSDSGLATSGAYQTSMAHYELSYLASFAPSGSINWATYFGNNKGEIGYGVAVDKSGNVGIAGLTFSTSGIASSGAYQTSFGGGYFDAFLAVFSNSGSLKWSTYYGGSSYDNANALGADPAGNWIITGYTESNSGIATKGAFQTFSPPSGGGTAFLAKFSSAGKLTWGTYIGFFELAYTLAVDPGGNSYISGIAAAADTTIITSGGYQTKFQGDFDAYITSFSPTGFKNWGTYFGKANYNEGYGIASNAVDRVCLTGWTSDSTVGLATKSVYQTKYAGRIDAFVAKFDRRNHDAGITKILSPTGNYCQTLTPLKVNLKNFGKLELDSVYINYTVNSKPGKSYLWKGKLKYDSSTVVTIANSTLPVGFDTVKAWTTLPNAVTDSVPDNDSAKTTDTIRATVKANAGGKKTICAGDSATLGSGSLAGHAYSWSSPTQISFASTGSVKVSPPGTTIYILTETLKSSGCSSIDSALVTVNPLPGNNTGGYQSVCSGDTFTLGYPSTTGHTYAWSSNPSGFSSSKAENTLRLTKSTTYFLTEKNTITGCVQTDSALITVLPLPAAYIGSNLSVCIGTEIKLGTKAIKGDSYAWFSKPAGIKSAQSTLDITPSVTSTLFLKETILATGCSKTDSTIVVVNPYPKPNAGGNRAICSGDSIVLGDSSLAGHQYQWSSSPAGFTSTSANPIVKPTITQNYILKETIIASGCAAKDSATIVFHTRPVAYTGIGKNICKGAQVTIGGNPISGNHYSWTSSPSGFVSTLSNPSFMPNASATYILKETDTSSGCSKMGSVSIIVLPAPASHPAINHIICAGDSVRLGDSAETGYAYNWKSAPAGFNSANNSPVVVPSGTTSYFVTKTNLATACSTIDTVNVKVNQLPTAIAGTTQSICIGSQVTIGASPLNNYIYRWASSTSSFKSSLSKITVQPSIKTIYYLTVKDTITGCMAFNSVQIGVNPRPQPKAGSGRSVCKGDTINLGDSSAKTGHSYQWYSIPAGFSVADAQTKADPGKNTWYVLTEKINSTGCIGKDSLMITVNPLPAPIIDGYDLICGNDTPVVFYGISSGGTKWLWTVKNGSVISGQNKSTANLKFDFGIDTVLLKVTDMLGCTGGTSKLVNVRQNPDARFKVLADSPAYVFKANDTLEQNYDWSLGDGSKESTYQVNHKYPFQKDTVITVSLKETSAFGCSSVFDTTVKIHFIPQLVFKIGVFPNPFIKTSLIQIELVNGARVNITVYDAIGRLITTLTDAVQGPGQKMYPLSSEKHHLSAGVYLVKIQIDDKVYVFKLIMVEKE